MGPSELPPDRQNLAERLKKMGLHGVAASLGGMADLAPVVELVGLEETDRRKRSYERRLRHARIGAFKSMADYDWRS
jgi:hypothetical protein